MKEFQRKIVRHVVTYEEKVSMSKKSYSWSRIEVHRLTASCGHVRVHRGMSPPTGFIICKDCKAGKQAQEIKGALGYHDLRDRDPKDPMAKALLDKELKKHTA